MIESYNDDRMQWKVDAIGPKVSEVRVNDRVLTHMNYNFTMLDDGRSIIPEKDVLMVFGSEARP